MDQDVWKVIQYILIVPMDKCLQEALEQEKGGFISLYIPLYDYSLHGCVIFIINH